MPDFEIPRSELVRTIVTVGALVTGPRPLQERMDGLCHAAAEVLNCAHLNIMVVDGDVYRGRYSVGLPPELSEHFTHYAVSRSKSMIAEIEACNSYLLIQDAKKDPSLARIAQMTGVESVVIVPFTHPDGSPLGYVTADFTSPTETITTEQADLALGMTRIAQSTLLRDLEVQRRQQITDALQAVEDNERRRMSLELRDDPLLRVLTLRTGLEDFHDTLTSDDKQAVVADLIVQCSEALASLSQVMMHVQPSAAELSDLEETLRFSVESARPAPAFRFTDSRTVTPPAYVTAALNRIAEQAVANALHHAHATELSVSLFDENEGSALTVIDNGIGFDPNERPPGHLGVVSMRERAESLDGTFSVNSSRGAGTVIHASLPHTSAAQEA